MMFLHITALLTNPKYVLHGLDLFDLFPDLCFDLVCQFGIVDQQLLYGVPSLSQLIIIVAEPTTALLHDTKLYAHIDDLSHFGNAFSENDIEFRLPEGRRYFILNDLHFNVVPYGFIAVLYLCHATYIQSHGSIKFQRISAGGCFGVSEHHADLFTKLVDKNAATVCF